MPAAAMATAAGVGLDEPPERAGQRGLHEQLADLGRPAARIEHRGAARRIEVELAARLRDGEQAVHVLVHREAVLGVLHGRREHLAQRPGAVGLEHGQVGVDGAGHRERQVGVRPRPGRDAIEPAAAERRERRQRRRRALAAHRRASRRSARRARAPRTRRTACTTRSARPRRPRSRRPPPRRRRCRRPAACACRPSTTSGWPAATTPCVPETTGRVVARSAVWCSISWMRPAGRLMGGRMP